MDKIKIDLGFAVLVVEKGIDNNYREIYLSLEDKNGVWLQDLAIVGQQYHYDTNGGIVHDKGIDVKVYTDCDNEDFTDEFGISIYEEED
jgi:hypothetical protein